MPDLAGPQPTASSGGSSSGPAAVDPDSAERPLTEQEQEQQPQFQPQAAQWQAAVQSSSSSSCTAGGGGLPLGRGEHCFLLGARHVLAGPAPLWNSSSGQTQNGGVSLRLDAGCPVFLVRVERLQDGRTMGLVIVGEAGDAGWLSLDGTEPPEEAETRRGSLLGRPQPVWRLNRVYRTGVPSSLRTGAALQSSLLREMPRGEAVLLLELDLSPGFARAGGVPRARLRAKVRAGRGEVGWLSPETAEGEPLLQFCDVEGEEPLKPGAPTPATGEPSTLFSTRDGLALASGSAACSSGEVLLEEQQAMGGSSPTVIGGDPSPRDLMSRFDKAIHGAPSPEAGQQALGGAAEGHGQAPQRLLCGLVLQGRPQEPTSGEKGVLFSEFAMEAHEGREVSTPLPSQRTARATDQAMGAAGCGGCSAHPDCAKCQCDDSPLSSWAHAVYARYNPGKLHRVCALLAEHIARGEEQELVNLIVEKYRVRPLPERLLRRPGGGPSGSGSKAR